jgi:hypothetical protein
LTTDITKRFTCAEALNHPWFSEAHQIVGMNRKFDPKILDRLKNYKGVSALRREALNVLVKMLDQQKIDDLR